MLTSESLKRINIIIMSAVWDESTQQYHGGQEWKFCKNFKEDFSVTTNGLGTPKPALMAAQKALQHINHYPPADQEPALSSLARFLWPSSVNGELILGNGASELIDLVIRSSAAGPWKPGPSRVQYMEYERSASSHGRQILPLQSKISATFFSLVNPCNPTGDYMNVQEIKDWISANVPDGATVTVDESMQLWVGPQWRQDSLVSERQWIRNLHVERNISVYVIHSWTKIWSCTGIRLGSVICPTAEHKRIIKSLQVPWSVNCMALAFLDEVVRDHTYLDSTWEVTKSWHLNAKQEIHKLYPDWKLYGQIEFSWIWIDTGSASMAEKVVGVSKEAGVPIRWGAKGYQQPTFIRIAVRDQHTSKTLFEAWKKLKELVEE